MYRPWNQWISAHGRLGSAYRVAATRSLFPHRCMSNTKPSSTAISWLRGDIQDHTLDKEEDRQALPKFLLQCNSTSHASTDESESRDPLRRMLLEHVHFNQQPVVDSYWMPEPLLYQTTLTIPRGYLQSLEEFQQKVEVGDERVEPSSLCVDTLPHTTSSLTIIRARKCSPREESGTLGIEAVRAFAGATHQLWRDTASIRAHVLLLSSLSNGQPKGRSIVPSTVTFE